jgi:hypothetical protein
MLIISIFKYALLAGANFTLIANIILQAETVPMLIVDPPRNAVYIIFGRSNNCSYAIKLPKFFSQECGFHLCFDGSYKLIGICLAPFQSTSVQSFFWSKTILSKTTTLPESTQNWVKKVILQSLTPNYEEYPHLLGPSRHLHPHVGYNFEN